MRNALFPIGIALAALMVQALTDLFIGPSCGEWPLPTC